MMPLFDMPQIQNYTDKKKLETLTFSGFSNARATQIDTQVAGL